MSTEFPPSVASPPAGWSLPPGTTLPAGGLPPGMTLPPGYASDQLDLGALPPGFDPSTLPPGLDPGALPDLSGLDAELAEAQEAGKRLYAAGDAMREVGTAIQQDQAELQARVRGLGRDTWAAYVAGVRQAHAQGGAAGLLGALGAMAGGLVGAPLKTFGALRETNQRLAAGLAEAQGRLGEVSSSAQALDARLAALDARIAPLRTLGVPSVNEAAQLVADGRQVAALAAQGAQQAGPALADGQLVCAALDRPWSPSALRRASQALPRLQQEAAGLQGSLGALGPDSPLLGRLQNGLPASGA